MTATKTLRVVRGLILCAALWELGAQNPTATLAGIVTDPTGSVVVGAQVEVRNSATNEVRKAETDQRDEFTVPKLDPGRLGAGDFASGLAMQLH